jgi:uncharacterized protein YndB with AHSA1/START domain
MAVNTVHVDAPPEQVFAVLTDPHTYPRWLAGAKRIRSVDDGWPAVGTAFHHQVGMGPLRINDLSKVIEIDPPTRLVLEVRARPVGRGKVTFVLRPEAAGTKLVQEEHPITTPLRVLTDPVLDASIHLRNSASLKRLKRFVESRSATSPA